MSALAKGTPVVLTTPNFRGERGVVVRLESEGVYQVYLPETKMTIFLPREELRAEGLFSEIEEVAK